MDYKEEAIDICKMSIDLWLEEDFDTAVQNVHDFLIDITGNYRDRIAILEERLQNEKCSCT